MGDKIKFLTIDKKRPREKYREGWEKTVETFAPDMYELHYGIAGKDACKKVSELQPGIVWVYPNVVKKNLEKGRHLVREIKRLSPGSAVFVLFDELDNEEEVFDAYTASGAFKCYVPVYSVNTIFHDMYVALNLE